MAMLWNGIPVLYARDETRRDETGPDLILIARVVSVVTELTLRRKTQLLSGRQAYVPAFLNVHFLHLSGVLFTASFNCNLYRFLDEQNTSDNKAISWYSLPLSNNCQGHSSYTSKPVSDAKSIEAQTTRLA